MSSANSDAMRPEKPLTEVELEMMNVIWKFGPCSVKDMLTHLSDEHPRAYTSVSTIVRILEQKGYVESQKQGRGHLYQAIIQKPDYQKWAMEHVVETVFDQAPAQLIMQLLDTRKLTSDDLSQIRALINKHEETR